uniref:Inositol polyphosphate-related phosphatase domain-containing protein n=1 Tax=Globodera rostochiensis TaxID=31243 RepID=A0A914H4E9_GLORO
MFKYRRLREEKEEVMGMDEREEEGLDLAGPSSSSPKSRSPRSSSSRLSHSQQQQKAEEFHSQFSEEDFQLELRQFGAKVLGPGGVSLPRRSELWRLLDSGEDAISVMCFTWNIAGKAACSLPQLNSLFTNMCPRERPSLIALALQEVPPSTLKFHASVVQQIGHSLDSTHRVFCWVRKWSQMLVIFVRHRLALFTSHPEYRFVAGANIARPFRTKGAIGICFRLLQCHCVFIACHLTHGKVDCRILDYHKMVRSFNFNWRPRTNGDEYANVFWFGDLNFRVHRVADVEKIARSFEQKTFWRPSDFVHILAHDELSAERQKGLFEGFCEGIIRFPPTHKFLIGTNLYVPNRMPSYTDRVLFRSLSSDSSQYLVPIRYDCVWDVTCSDHKPVYCTFRMSVVRKKKGQVENG